MTLPFQIFASSHSVDEYFFVIVSDVFCQQLVRLAVTLFYTIYSLFMALKNSEHTCCCFTRTYLAYIRTFGVLDTEQTFVNDDLIMGIFIMCIVYVCPAM